MVKFRDHVPIPYEDGAEHYFEGIGDRSWSALAAHYPGLTLKRMFTVLRPRQIEALVARAQLADPSYHPPNFFTNFFVEGPDPNQVEQVAQAFAAWPLVEHAQAQVDVEPPYVGWENEERLSTQPQIDPPPRGVDSKHLWALGADGTGVLVLDIEQGWAQHEDLPPLPDPIFGVSRLAQGHGTAVLGILVAIGTNGKGIVGIAPNASFAISSSVLSHTDDIFNEPEAVMVASSAMTFGDVMLIELHQRLPESLGGNRMPLEYNRAAHSCIRLATALGIIVVEAAGNGKTRIDDHLPEEESGAILVSAARSADLTRDTESNFGDRVSCFAWGDGVGTTGDGGSGEDPAAYSLFQNTSAAAAVVAGATVLYQSFAQSPASALNFRLGPKQMRAMLVANGYPAAATESDPIGVMPDLGQLASASGVDIYLRDHIGDDGTPHDGPIGLSPDIILRHQKVPDADAAFGEPSGTRDRDDLSDLFGSRYIYVRALNRGTKDAQNVVAHLYTAGPSPFPYPTEWSHLGDLVIGHVPAGNTLKISPNPLTWDGPPSSGHVCLIALLEDIDDPAPDLVSFWRRPFIDLNLPEAWPFNAVHLPGIWPSRWFDADSYARFLRNNNNVALRCLSFISIGDIMGRISSARAEFVAAGLDIWRSPPTKRDFSRAAWRRYLEELKDEDRPKDMVILELVKEMDTAVRVRLEIPDLLMPEPVNGRVVDPTRDSPRGFTVIEDDGKRPAAVRLQAPRGVHSVKCRIVVGSSDRARLVGARVGVRQVLGDWEMGRFVWQFTNESPRRRRLRDR
jgi:hypothetical protein